jgi:hypothetical protein
MLQKEPVRFGRGRLDPLGYKGLAAYLILGFSRVARVLNPNAFCELY